MRLAKRIAQAFVVVFALLLVAAVVGSLATQTAWFKTWLRGYIVQEAHQYLSGELSIGRIRGNLFSEVELEDVGLTINGEPVLSINNMALRYKALELVGKGVTIRSIRIQQPVVYMKRDGDAWSIGRLIKKEREEVNRRGPGRPVTIDELTVSGGRMEFETQWTPGGLAIPTRIQALDARLVFHYDPVRYSVEIERLSLRAEDPVLEVLHLSTGVAVKDDDLHFSRFALRTRASSVALDGAVRQYLTNPSLDLRIHADTLSLPEVGRIVPSLSGIELQPAFEVQLAGPLDRLAADMQVRSAAGNVRGHLLADLAAPDHFFRGELALEHLDLAPILRSPESASDLTARVKPDLKATSLSDLQSLRGKVELDAVRSRVGRYGVERMLGTAAVRGRVVDVQGTTSAYGAAATFWGTLTLPADRERFSYALQGDVRSLNLSTLPPPAALPMVDSNLNGSYHVRGIGTSSVEGGLGFTASTIVGARIASGGSASVSVKAQADKSPLVEYQADASIFDLDLRRAGKAFGAVALDNDRYQTNLNTHVQATGRGSSWDSTELTVSGDAKDSVLFGAKVPRLAFDATLGGDAVRMKASGTFADLDPRIARPDLPVDGALAGSLDVEGTLAHLSGGFDLDSLNGGGKVTLEPSRFGDLQIDSANLEARLEQQALDVQALELVGHGLTVHGRGMVSLAAEGMSDLGLQAESTDLSGISALVGQAITGIGKTEAKVTGNRTKAIVEGTLLGNDIEYKGAGALTLSTTYQAEVPNLSIRDAAVTATSNGTFVSIGGQHINEVALTTAYDRSRLDVDLTAKQAQGSMNVSGTALFRPDEEEVRLTRLDLTAQDLQWHLGAEGGATIRYANGVTRVKDLRMTNGGQQVVADGVFGSPSEGLTLTLKDVDLHGVDAVFLRPPQLAGSLNASGTITGPTDAMRAKADFEVSHGGFRAFRYDSLKGSAESDGRTLRLDSILQQNASARVRVNGRVPLAAFRRGDGDRPTTSSATSASDDDGIDLRLESTPIDLGIVQGLTTVLTNVKGTAQATVRISGSVDNPRPTGTIVVKDGAFKIKPTGGVYKALNGRIELQNDRAHIVQFDVLDNHDSFLSLTGAVPIRPSPSADVSLQVTARDFRILDNDMGNVRVNSDLNLAGELRALRLEGDLAVSTGTVNLDPLLAVFGESAYATTPTEYLSARPDGVRAGSSRERDSAGPTGLRIDVHLSVPDDLVVKSKDLQLPSSPIGLGAINVTLGGDLRATKEPGQTARLVGTVNAVRGTYQFQGRQFRVLRDGAIRFNGDPINRLNPTLDVQTQRVVQGVQANVNILGTLRRPRIELASVPPLERADIFSLIVFNQPVNELGEGQRTSLAQRAEQLAVGSIASGLSTSLGSLLRVSEFQIGASSETNAAAQLTIGQQVGQNLFVRVEYSVGDVSTANLVVEYELKRWLRLQTNLIQSGAAEQAPFQSVHDSGFNLIVTFTR